MDIVIDLSPIYAFFELPVDQQVLLGLINFGWIPIAVVILWGAWLLWIYYRNILYDLSLRNVLLAIDIPRGNEQSPKAVENMFTYFGGAHYTPTWLEKVWEGKFQLGFSFEIVSIEGYTQFLIRCPVKYRDLTETAVYAVYPDAEITEVNDYTEGIPDKWPNDEYAAAGAEFIPAKSDAYPIKTYKDFENELAGRPETQFKDSMATLMDLCASMKKGEQLWYQIIVYPTGYGWMEDKQKEVKKILKEKTGPGKGPVDGFIDGIFNWVNYILESGLGLFEPASSGSQEEKDDSLKMMNLKPQEKKQVEAIQHKASKLGFEVKNRFVYVAKKEVANKKKALNGFIGYMKQFMDLDLNNLKPDYDVTGTSTDYFFAEARLNERIRKIISAYKGRSGTRGRSRKIFNIEELATLWHFPVEASVRAPLIQKAPGRRAEPPMSLPIEEGAPAPAGDLAEDEKGEVVFYGGEEDEPGPGPRPESKPPPAAGKEEGEEPEARPWAEPARPGPKVADIRAPEPARGRGRAPGNLPFAD